MLFNMQFLPKSQSIKSIKDPGNSQSICNKLITLSQLKQRKHIDKIQCNLQGLKSLARVNVVNYSPRLIESLKYYHP